MVQGQNKRRRQRGFPAFQKDFKGIDFTVLAQIHFVEIREEERERERARESEIMRQVRNEKD